MGTLTYFCFSNVYKFSAFFFKIYSIIHFVVEPIGNQTILFCKRKNIGYFFSATKLCTIISVSIYRYIYINIHVLVQNISGEKHASSRTQQDNTPGCINLPFTNLLKRMPEQYTLMKSKRELAHGNTPTNLPVV